MHTHTHIYIYTHTHIYIQIHTHIYIYIHNIDIYTHIPFIVSANNLDSVELEYTMVTARESLASMTARDALNPYEIVPDSDGMENMYATVGIENISFFSCGFTMYYFAKV